jgi:hypothetical protein
MNESSFRTMHKNAKTRPVLERVLTAERLDQLGADPVFEGPQATVTPPYEYSYRSGVEQDSEGNWTTVYSVGPVFVEYTDGEGVVQTVDAQTTAYRAGIDETKGSDVRTTRNKLLDESDWTQMNDSPLDTAGKTAWATYRQELRDLSDHANWPHLSDEDWPTKPS